MRAIPHEIKLTVAVHNSWKLVGCIPNSQSSIFPPCFLHNCIRQMNLLSRLQESESIIKLEQPRVTMHIIGYIHRVVEMSLLSWHKVSILSGLLRDVTDQTEYQPKLTFFSNVTWTDWEWLTALSVILVSKVSAFRGSDRIHHSNPDCVAHRVLPCPVWLTALMTMLLIYGVLSIQCNSVGKV